MLVVAVDVVQAPNDKQQIEPMLDKIESLPTELGEAETLLADTGYFSAGNVEACEKAGVDRRSPWGVSRITRRWKNASNRRRRRQKIRRRSKRWRIG